MTWLTRISTRMPEVGLVLIYNIFDTGGRGHYVKIRVEEYFKHKLYSVICSPHCFVIRAEVNPLRQVLKLIILQRLVLVYLFMYNFPHASATPAIFPTIYNISLGVLKS